MTAHRAARTTTRRTIAAAESQPARVTAKATKAPAKAAVSQTAAAPAFDVSSLASGVTTAGELPKVRRDSAALPFLPLVQRSWDEKTALATPRVPAENVRAVHVAIRRAATVLGLGVSIRDDVSPAGTVVTFQAKERAVRKAAK